MAIVGPVINREPRRLQGRQPLPQPFLPWPFLIGFAGMSVFGLVRHLWSSREALAAGGSARTFALAFAGVIVAAGAGFLAAGWPGLRGFLARQRLEAERPKEPWTWSARPWDPEKCAVPGGVFRFARYPFFLGGAVEGSLSLHGALASAPGLVVTLRHLHEQAARTRLVDCLYEDDVRIPTVPGSEVPVRIPLPRDRDLTTVFSTSGDHYWVLDVEADPPGGERVTFLVPVYAAGGA